MNKTVKPMTEASADSAFTITERARDLAENAVAQSKQAYAKVQDQAEAARRAIETTVEITPAIAAELSRKTLSALRANSEAGFGHIEALLGATSIGDWIDLQRGFARKQTEAITDQIKEFQVLAIKALEDVSAPIKSIVEEAVKETNPIWP